MAIVGKPLSARILAQASTRQGSHHWLLERVTSVALIPLTLWFIVAAVSLSGASYEEVRAWLATPFNTTAMLLLIFTTFWHAQLGVQVIIEDYTHHDITKLGSLMAVNFALIALGLACVVAVLKVSFGS
jgi:succinate dehydrogenase / fumarate reductase, membrane anchor subunit